MVRILVQCTPGLSQQLTVGPMKSCPAISLDGIDTLMLFSDSKHNADGQCATICATLTNLSDSTEH